MKSFSVDYLCQRKEVMVLGLSICLSVCLLDYSKKL